MTANYCPSCGTALEERHQKGVHQLCDCGHFIGNNPVTVNVVLVPIRRADDTLGLLAGRRQIEPGSGKLSLPAGYQEVGESSQQGAVRELHEELGVSLKPSNLTLYDLQGNRPNTQTILCWLAPEMRESELPPFVPNDEVTERVVVCDGADMAFPSHARWTNRLISGQPRPSCEQIGFQV